MKGNSVVKGIAEANRLLSRIRAAARRESTFHPGESLLRILKQRVSFAVPEQQVGAHLDECPDHVRRVAVRVERLMQGLVLRPGTDLVGVDADLQGRCQPPSRSPSPATPSRRYSTPPRKRRSASTPKPAAERASECLLPRNLVERPAVERPRAPCRRVRRFPVVDARVRSVGARGRESSLLPSPFSTNPTPRRCVITRGEIPIPRPARKTSSKPARHASRGDLHGAAGYRETRRGPLNGTSAARWILYFSPPSRAHPPVYESGSRRSSPTSSSRESSRV